MDAVRQTWTVWLFRGPTSGEEKVVARVSEPGEIEHEYQKVLGRVEACTAAEAIDVWCERRRHES